MEPPCPTIYQANMLVPMGQASLQAPILAESLNIDTRGFYVLLHRRPGSANAISGVLIDFAYQMNRWTVFALALARLLAPIDQDAQAVYQQLFTCLMALPHCYHEAISDFNQRNVLSPFQLQEGPTFLLSQPQCEAHRVPNMGIQDVVDTLLDNRVPPAWVDHSYLYGLAYLDAHYSGNGLHQALFDKPWSPYLSTPFTPFLPFLHIIYCSRCTFSITLLVIFLLLLLLLI